jgi:hypothetical protein
VVELPFAADCCPCVEKLRTVLPFTVGLRDGAVQLVSILSSAVISAAMGLYRIRKWPIKCHLRTIKPQSRGVKMLY